jgi:hypothetical protein
MAVIDVSIKWPFKWCLVGSSGSGKTNFCLQIISNSSRLFDTPPSKIVLIYKEFQNIYNQFDKFIPTQLYHEDEVDLEEITRSNKERLLVICDDLYYSKKLDEVAEQFLIKGRHRNTSWIVLTQSIFNRPALKNISRNSTHITLFKTVRLNEPHIFFSQLRPRASKVLQNIFAKATENSFSYLDIDLSQTCPDKFRYKAELFNRVVPVFIIMNDSTFKTMYLLSKSDLYRNEGDKFKLTLENEDICENGLNVSVKPMRSRKAKIKNVKINSGNEIANNENNDNNTYLDNNGRTTNHTQFADADSNTDTILLNDTGSNTNHVDFSDNNGRATNRAQFNDAGSNTDTILLNDTGSNTNHVHFSDNDGRSTNCAQFNDAGCNTDTIQLNDTGSNTNHAHFADGGTNTAESLLNENINSVRKLTNNIPSSNAKPTAIAKRVRDDTDSLDQQERVKRNKDSDDVSYMTKTNLSNSVKRPTLKYYNSLNKHRRFQPYQFLDKNKKTPVISVGSKAKHTVLLKDEDVNMEPQGLEPEDMEPVSMERQGMKEMTKREYSKNVSPLKRRKVWADIKTKRDEQWIEGLKSKINDRRVQFKRKRNTVGYRITPEDVNKSLIKPSDFNFLTPAQSEVFLDKWKPLKELKEKKNFTNKRFKPYRSFSVWKRN